MTTIFTHTKTRVAAAVILASTAGSAMAADYAVYGKAEVQIANTDTGVMRYVDEGTQIEAPFSRIGIKGSHKLTESLKAVFKYEVQVKGFEHDDTSEPFSARNTYLGLAGDFGEVVVGRNDTRFKYSEGKVDGFNETQADIAQLIPGQDRIGDTITYSSKTYGGASLALTYAPKDDSSNDEDGFAATVIYGDRALKSKDYYVAISHVDALNKLTASRVVAAWKLENLQLAGLFQRSESTDGTKEGNGYAISASYAIDKWVPKLQYVKDDSKIRHAEEGKQWTAGVDYVFDKQTTAYLFYTDLDLELESDNSVALGLKYKF
ncbi:porin [Pseudoalteromonas lipolytica]|uniref:Porin n=1 Tax=Pseudoalteromonas lipolytica TaxID=570156 RepID=A0A0N8HKP7_9GAMM|nr:porin [Pseudoalteromonas lipolytica]KPM84472.1 porin [Pseudoalteromonas lipolytica]